MARPSESEIIDVLLGGADPAIEERVRRAVLSDLATASRYAQWGETLSAIRAQSAPAKTVGERVRQGVAARLPQERCAMAENPSAAADPLVRIEEGFGAAVLCALLGPPVDRRRRWLVASTLLTASAVVAAGILILIRQSQLQRDVRVEAASGDVVWSSDVPGAPRRSLQRGDRFPLPARVQTAETGEARLRLPDRTFLVANSGAELRLRNSRLVRQLAGVAMYSVGQPHAQARFTVFVPQGAVVDLGTEFEVRVSDALHSVVRVATGRVRVDPLQGESVRVSAGERAIMNPTRAVVEAVANPAGPVPAPTPRRVGRTAPAKPRDVVRLPYNPRREILSPSSNLAGFIRPRAVTLTRASAASLALKKTPPFASESPLAGSFQTRAEGRPVDVSVVCDRKLNGKWKVYVDANANNDLTDDPAYAEGEDFFLGKPFRVTLPGRDNVAWLSWPIRVDLKANPPQALPVEDRLDLYNPLYFQSEVKMPEAPSGPAAPRLKFLLFDGDSNGEYADGEGGLGVWVAEESGAPVPRVLAVAPFGGSTLVAGYKWRISRDITGAYVLNGQKVSVAPRKKLRVGELLPRLRVSSVTGESIDLAPPPKGYLLLYVWSTWFSACQRDVPFDFNDLYPRFKNRGFAMVGLSVDYRKQDLLNYMVANQVGYPQVFNGPDLTEGLAGQLGIDQAPVAILVDPAGRVLSIGKGADEIWSFLDSHLPE